jgi:hypothetical protein
MQKLRPNMSQLRHFLSKNKMYLAIGFWYLALYPGRLGYDYSLAIRMIQDGESTNWWTAFYFWILRITSFNGRSIALISLIGLIVLALSLKYFLYTLISNKLVAEKTLFFTLLTPLYGVFGATVSHDVFQTAAILFFLGLFWKLHLRMISRREIGIVFLCSSLLIITTQTGIFTVFVAALFLTVFKFYKEAIFGFSIALTVSLISNFGIGPSIIKNPLVNIMLVDMKCVVQHPDAEVSDESWRVLTALANRDLWLEPKSCSIPDAIIGGLGIGKEDIPIERSLIRTYVELLSAHPAIVLQAHLQRSLGALPPPFFQGPRNQVDQNIDNPVGLGTNTALQLGPEILHPSIDEPSVANKIGFLKPLEIIAQVPTFLVNQASWFWGWGGLWLWPLIGFYLYVLKVRKFLLLISLLSPTLILHLSYVMVGPSPIGRYYFSTILAGFSLAIAMLCKSLIKKVE